ncbi:MAG: hypothetical protein KGI50_02575 [Patescibacteria group bacterium]|nr:hypothetical protein [Patescibacteria group bacterium]MDE2438603.1 hypothetical protein [Patescibacteria group bacterium]
MKHVDKNALLGAIMAGIVVTATHMVYHPSVWILVASGLLSFPYQIGRNTYGIFGGFSDNGFYKANGFADRHISK